MSKLELLVRRYEKFCALPWERSLAGPQRVWFVVYDPVDERRLRTRLPEFGEATTNSGHKWSHVDITDDFGCWVAAQEYRDSYFECPEDIDTVLPQFEQELINKVRAALEGGDESTIVAVSGIGSLFGIISVASLVQGVAPSIRGRMAIFFPGSFENNNYRLLDAKDGWNYLAVVITSHEGGDAQ